MEVHYGRKRKQPTIQMKNSSIVIVKNSASIIFGLFSFSYSLQGLFVNRNALNGKKKREELKVKGFPFRKAFYSSSYFPSVPIPFILILLHSKIMIKLSTTLKILARVTRFIFIKNFNFIHH